MVAVVGGAFITPSAITGRKTGVIATPLVVVPDGDRQRPPTGIEVLGAIAAVGHPGTGPLGLPDHMADDLAVALLRQRYGPMPEAGIGALADALADLILDPASDTDKSIDARSKARSRLRRAAMRPERQPAAARTRSWKRHAGIQGRTCPRTATVRAPHGGVYVVRVPLRRLLGRPRGNRGARGAWLGLCA